MGIARPHDIEELCGFAAHPRRTVPVEYDNDPVPLAFDGITGGAINDIETGLYDGEVSDVGAVPHQGNDPPSPPIPKGEQLPPSLFQLFGFGCIEIRKLDGPGQTGISPVGLNEIQVPGKSPNGPGDVEKTAPQESQLEIVVVNVRRVSFRRHCCVWDSVVDRIGVMLLLLLLLSLLLSYEQVGFLLCRGQDLQFDSKGVEGVGDDLWRLVHRERPYAVDFFVDGVPIDERQLQEFIGQKIVDFLIEFVAILVTSLCLWLCLWLCSWM